MHRNAVRRAHAGHHPDPDRVRRNAQLLVDAHRRRHPAVAVLPAAAGVRREAAQMIESFGSLEDGRRVEAVTLGSADGLQAQILTYGGILRRLTFPRRGAPQRSRARPPRPRRLRAGRRVSSAFSSGASPTGSRDAQFELGRPAPSAHRQRGPQSVARRQVRLRQAAVAGARPADRRPRHQLVLGLRSPEGEEGYPGNLDVTAEFIVDDRRAAPCASMRDATQRRR